MLQLECLKEVIEDIKSEKKLNDGEAEEHALNTLWSLRSECAGNPNLSNITVYQKYDRSCSGSISKGSLAPDVPLADRKGNKIFFYDYINDLNVRTGEKRPIFVIAGSVT